MLIRKNSIPNPPFTVLAVKGSSKNFVFGEFNRLSVIREKWVRVSTENANISDLLFCVFCVLACRS